MRKFLLATLVAVCAVLAPLSAQAKRYHGDTNLNSRAVTKHARSSGGGESSRSCLTSEARRLLSRIEAQFGSVEIVSTCRPGARIATSGNPSKHASGQAIDFRVSGKKGKIVQLLYLIIA